ncbi:phage holin family protein [Ornithinimicrobium sp. LYQ103]|uniref:phage holin family protein n=1 Tax=Ornithinimicrobium sp. LYQ103 TaxID=3378796 RepID=UPI003853CCF5
MTYPGSGGAHAFPDPSARVASAPGDVRPAEQIDAAHGSYDKGEIGSIGALVGDITSDLSTLMRQEVALAKAEAKQSATQAGKGAGLLSGAALAGWFTLLFLSIALWWALGEGMGRVWAAVVVALIWAVIAGILAVMGRSQLQNVKGLPHTVETAKKVPDALKGNEDHA